jgi:hypothetical protein
LPDVPERWREVHQRALKGEVVTDDDDRFDRADGTVKYLRWEVRPWFDEDGTGRCHHLCGGHHRAEEIRGPPSCSSTRSSSSASTIAPCQLEQTIEKLQYAPSPRAEGLRNDLARAGHSGDPLTGLFNRRFMEESRNNELARARAAQIRVSAVIMLGHGQVQAAERHARP